MHRKDMIPMIATILVIVIAFFAVQYFFFPAKPPAQTGNAANAPSNAPAANTPSTPAESKPAEAQPAPVTDRAYAPLDRRSATTRALANSKLTATFTERGGVLDSLVFMSHDGTKVFLKTPNDPTHKPEEVLELIKPMRGAEYAAPMALRFDDKDAQRNLARWELVDGPRQAEDSAQTLTYRFPPAGEGIPADGLVFFKTFALYPESFRIDVSLRIENHSAKEVSPALGLWGPGIITNDGIQHGADHTRVALYGSTNNARFTDLHESPTIAGVASELEDINEDRVDAGQAVQEWTDNRTLDDETGVDRFLLAHGVRTQYFVAFLAADPEKRDAGWKGEILSLKDIREAATSLTAPAVTVAAATGGKPGSAEVAMRFYAGPRDKEALETAWFAKAPTTDDTHVAWRELAPTGWPAIISAPLVWVLARLTEAVGPGLAIILLTLIVRTILSPLSYRGQKSMAVYTQKMKVVKPRLDKIKEKYEGKKDRDSQLKMLTETREAMKEQNVGMLPLGGCLPMLVQLPIFIGLYRAFGSAFFLRQAEFLWIHDLSLPDATIPYSFDLQIGLLSFLAHNGFFTINLLPVLWIVLSLVQMRMQPKPDDPQQAAMQKQMGCIFPLMGLFFYAFASGFAFYFIVSSLYSLGESKLIKRNLIRAGITPAPLKDKPKPGDKPQYHTS